MPKLWARKDLLCILHAAMPTRVLWEPHQDLFRANTDRFMECYRNVCGWRRAVGYSELINHERLTEDAKVQRSTFANGAAVTVNFAHEPRTVDGVIMPPRSYLLTGDPKVLAGLPVGRCRSAIRGSRRPSTAAATPGSKSRSISGAARVG